MEKFNFRTPYSGPFRLHASTVKKTGDWRDQRPVVKTEKCSQCGWCYLYCPTGCVVQQGDRFEPNLDFCKGCGICAAECPVNAIIMIREKGNKQNAG